MKTELAAGRATPVGDDSPLAEEALKPPLALIVGLGNPGPEYANHRHNIGFQIVQSLANAHGLAFVRHKKAKARVAEGKIGERTVLLAKPQTFMNLSGKTVARLSRDRDIPPGCILVVHDDLDLPLGRLRARPNGGSGGHNGLRSIIETLGSRDFVRLRVGIDRPPGSLDPAEYVLEPFAGEDGDLVAETVGRAVQAVESWLAEGIVATMDRFNRPPSSSNEDIQDEQDATAGTTVEQDAGQAALLSPSAPFQLSSSARENGA
jgi:PTH1 family peptidyl-tRNA hydrolase